MRAHWQPVAAQPIWLVPWGWHRRRGRTGVAKEVLGRKSAGLRLLAAAAILLTAACATAAKYQTYVNGFVGKGASQLYAVWGAPLRSAPTPDGGQVVSYLTNVQSGRGFGVEGCETSFILDRGGTVRQASFRGDACFAP